MLHYLLLKKLTNILNNQIKYEFKKKEKLK